jgi:hypothetical protein
MRAIVPVILVLAAAAASVPPAAAQVALTLQRDNELWAAQQSARQREIAARNELGVLDARVRTDEALRDLDQQRRAAPITTPKNPKAFDPGVFVSMPDSRLAASNARVRAAAGEGR